jgi:hypothetical protein
MSERREKSRRRAAAKVRERIDALSRAGASDIEIAEAQAAHEILSTNKRAKHRRALYALSVVREEAFIRDVLRRRRNAKI